MRALGWTLLGLILALTGMLIVGAILWVGANMLLYWLPLPHWMAVAYSIIFAVTFLVLFYASKGDALFTTLLLAAVWPFYLILVLVGVGFDVKRALTKRREGRAG